jgi:hypothetical protein
MNSNDWLTGIYLTTSVVSDHPDYVTRLRDEIGLNTVVLGFTGEMSDEVMKLSPYGGKTPSDEVLEGLILKHFDGRPIDPREYEQARNLCGPGVSANGDDATFRKVVTQLKDAGLDVWTYGGAWTIRRLMFCPSNPDTRRWMEAACVHWATEYGLDALDITHFRYPMGSFPLGLFGCTCSHCRVEAGNLGYDMDDMVAALKDARAGLRKLDGKRLGDVARLGFGFFDVLHALNLPSGVLDWVNFRCDLVVENLMQFKAAVHAASPETRFGTDTYPASMALTAGHDYRRWDQMADFASPLVSHISAFVCNTFIEWAQFLQDEIEDLTEEDALQVVYRFLGYDGMGLPETIAAYGHEDAATLADRIPTSDLVLRDLVKAKLLLPEGVPSYPILHGEGWGRETSEGIVKEMKALGHNGVVWQGTADLLSDK